MRTILEQFSQKPLENGTHNTQIKKHALIVEKLVPLVCIEDTTVKSVS